MEQTVCSPYSAAEHTRDIALMEAEPCVVCGQLLPTGLSALAVQLATVHVLYPDRMNSETMIDLVGWMSALILLATLIAQVRAQWRDRSSKGVSRWLFVGQLAASAGFIIYSALTHNMVFVITNILIASVALVGQFTSYRNRKQAR